MARDEPGSSSTRGRVNRTRLWCAGGLLLGLSSLAGLAANLLPRDPSRAIAPPTVAENLPATLSQPESAGAPPETLSSPAAESAAAAGEGADPERSLADQLAAIWGDPGGRQVGRKMLLTSSLDTRRLLLAALCEHNVLYHLEEDERLDLAADLITLHFETTDAKFKEDVHTAIAELAGEDVARELELRDSEAETETDSESDSDSDSETETETETEAVDNGQIPE
jgi:hypothetical protein